MVNVEDSSVLEDRNRGFARSLRNSIRVRDCVALAVVPVLLVSVYVVPDPVKIAYAFDYTNPTLLTAYTAHFVHLQAGHLATNIAGYVLLAGTTYLLAVLTGHRRLFVVATTTYLAAFPPVLSTLNLAIPRDAITYGFSGIVMAFAGLLPLLLSIYVRERLAVPIGVRRAPAVFFVTLAVISLAALPLNPIPIAVAGMAVLVALWYTVSRITEMQPRTASSVRSVAHSGWFELSVVAIVLTFAYPLIGFLPPVSSSGAITNLYAHLLGYCLAFMVPYIALEMELFHHDEGTRPADN